MRGWSPQVELCPPEARERALQVLYQRVPESLRFSLIVEVLKDTARGLVDLSGLWIAWNQPWGLEWLGPRSQIIGAILTQALPGRAAAIWPPEVQPSLRRATTAAVLVQSALRDLQTRGFRIVQAVLDESASRRGGGDLTRGGMPRVTELLYLERETRLSLPGTTLMGSHSGSRSRECDGAANPLDASGQLIVPSLVWQPFHMAREEEFRAKLQASYTSSLDMPELEGVRSLDDILEGHRATGRFVPDRWQLGQVPGEPQAAVILMLSEVPDRDVWEVVYLGLTPAARGRGLGHQAIAHALELARPHASRLELAVDIRNRPATRLYNATGFVVFDRRSVHLAVYPENA